MGMAKRRREECEQRKSALANSVHVEIFNLVPCRPWTNNLLPGNPLSKTMNRIFWSEYLTELLLQRQQSVGWAEARANLRNCRYADDLPPEKWPAASDSRPRLLCFGTVLNRVSIASPSFYLLYDHVSPTFVCLVLCLPGCLPASHAHPSLSILFAQGSYLGPGEMVLCRIADRVYQSCCVGRVAQPRCFFFCLSWQLNWNGLVLISRYSPWRTGKHRFLHSLTTYEYNAAEYSEASFLMSSLGGAS